MPKILLILCLVGLCWLLSFAIYTAIKEGKPKPPASIGEWILVDFTPGDNPIYKKYSPKEGVTFYACKGYYDYNITAVRD